MPMFAVSFAEHVGICRWCRCTDINACPAGCSWANRERTLCSCCVSLDKALRTIEGRRELAEFVQEAGFLAGGGRARVKRR